MSVWFEGWAVVESGFSRSRGRSMHRNRGHCGETASGACGCDGGVTVDAPSLASAGDDDTDDDAEPERERSDATCSGILSSRVGLRFGGGHECVSCWFGETKSRPYDAHSRAAGVRSEEGVRREPP